MDANLVLVLEVVFFALAILVFMVKNADKFKVSKDIWGVYQDKPGSNRQEGLPVITFSRVSTGVKVDKLVDEPHATNEHPKPREK